MGGNPLLPFSPVSGHRSLFSSCMFLPPSDTSLLLSAPGYAGRAHRALAPIVKVQKVLCQGAPGTPVPSRPCPSRALPLKKKGTPGCLFRHLPQTSGIEGKASKGVLLSRPLSDFSTMRRNGLGLRYCRYMNNTAVLWGLGSKRV